MITLRPPIEITARLLPGVRVGGAFISIEYACRNDEDGRTCYRYHIDLPGGFEHSRDNLRSSVGGGNLQEGLATLLSFLEACGDSYRWWLAHGRNGERGENQDLFPEPIAEWACQYNDALSLLRFQFEQATEPLIEE